MELTQPVQNVPSTVLLVSKQLIVKLVLLEEKLTHQHVHVQMTNMKHLPENVKIVTTNVVLVILAHLIVLFVLPTELNYQHVLAQMELTTSITKKNVQNVKINVKLVLTQLITV